MISRTAAILLPVGEIILERDGYGSTNLGKLTERPRVRTLFLTGTGDPAGWEEPASEDDSQFTCPICGYIWTPKTFAPKRCPQCHAILTIEGGWGEVVE
jgi:ssDNA-binding Zn-finger/Zn-ribbon topoisomerase 1